MVPRKKKATKSARPKPSLGPPAASRQPPWFDGEPPSGIEGGKVERIREDDLIGTSSSHTPARDLRAEEPAGELSPSADTEGRGD